MKIIIRYDIAPAHLQKLRERFPSLVFSVCTDDAQLARDINDASVLIGGWKLPENLVRVAPQLVWVQSTYTGVESFLTPELKRRGIVVTNFRGIAASNVAEHVLALMFAFARNLPELMRRQSRVEWRPYGQEPMTFELQGQSIGIIGLGEIGRAIARRARGIGMSVWAIRRNASGVGDPDADWIAGPADLGQLLDHCEHVVLALPRTADTQSLMNADGIARMRAGAFFYNVSRGDLVDQNALIDALRDGRLAGAGLDVTSPEPLPATSPLWSMPNVIITSHTSGPTPAYWDRGIALISDNIDRFLSSRPLRNVVDLKHGY